MPGPRRSALPTYGASRPVLTSRDRSAGLRNGVRPRVGTPRPDLEQPAQPTTGTLSRAAPIASDGYS